MTVQHVAWGKTSWTAPQAEARRVEPAGPSARSSSRPTTAARLLETCLASLARHRPAGRPDRGHRRRRRLDRRHRRLAGARPSRRPRRPARAQRRLLRARPTRGSPRRAGAFIQLLNNDTEVTAGLDRGGPGPVRRPDGRLGRAPGPGPVRPVAASIRRATRYALIGWPSKRGHGQPAARLARPPRRPRLRRQRLERLLPGRGPAAGRRLRPVLRLVLRGRRPRLPAPLGRLRVRLRPAMPDPARGLGQLRPRPPRPPAADVAERRGPLLDRPARRPGSSPPSSRTWRSSLAQGALAARPGPCPARSSWASSTPSGRSPTCGRGGPSAPTWPGRRSRALTSP